MSSRTENIQKTSFSEKPRHLHTDQNQKPSQTSTSKDPVSSSSQMTPDLSESSGSTNDDLKEPSASSAEIQSPLQKEQVGLVLEGGAMRGMFTAGVLDTLMDTGIQVNGIAGVSAGALFGVNYVSGQKGRAVRYSKRFNPQKDYLGLLPLLREGNIVSTEFAYHTVPEKLDPFDNEAYQKAGIPFWAVVTNLETGKPEYMQIKDVFRQMDTLRASGSMPFVSRPVEIHGQSYLDGGISDSIPFKWLASRGYNKLIVILTRDLTYVKKPLPAGPVRMALRQHPKTAQAMISRHQQYNASIQELRVWEKEGKAFVIQPSRPIEIGKIEKDPKKLQEIYDLGCQDARKALPALRRYLGLDAENPEDTESTGKRIRTQ